MREFIHMTFARRLRFRASLLKIGVDGFVGVARDRAAAYGSTLTGRKTAPHTDFDPFSAQSMRDPYPGYRALLTGPNVPNVWYASSVTSPLVVYSSADTSGSNPATAGWSLPG